ncbi:universal stress protein [Actinoplanes sp. NPDC024001]|uniref:universal stress protein n=1 Tax=Actinoplanes sp. NPDC024001 TaxID=3154598 RepID=UPI0033F30FA2
MTDLSRFRAETEARRAAGEVRHPNRFGEMMNRYLGAADYRDPYAVAPKPAPETHPQPTYTATGVVLVGVDDSPISCVAVDHAAIEAELHGWALHIVNVRRSGSDGAGAGLLRRLTDRVHASSPTVPVSSRLVAGAHPAQALIVEAGDAGLLVVGHRHGATTTALGRSVADRVGRHHAGPVLVIRMPGWPAGPEFGTRPIVAAVDGSAPSRAAVEFALAEALTRGCDVVLLHVVGDRMDLARRLETRDGVQVHHRIISGDPVTALTEESGRAAAVVVGRYEHPAFSGSLLGSAAHLLPQRALCPVFLVG